MSYTRLVADDFVVSSDAISSTCWTTGNPTLSTFFTSSTQANGSSGNYYLNVYNTASNESSSAVQFGIAYGNSYGSGSANYNSAVNGKSPTATIWGQWQDLVLGDENANFVFGAVTSSQFFAVTMERACYKDAIFLGSLTLKLSGSQGVITLTDNSHMFLQFLIWRQKSIPINFRSEVLNTQIVEHYRWLFVNSGSYGWLLPDIGTILLNPLALGEPPISGGIGFTFSGSAYTGNVAYNAATNANASLFRAMSGSSANVFTLNSQETITSDYVFVRPRSSEYNYSENPSFISGSTGEVLYPQFINNPQTYITTIGLYNDTNDLLAVAKLSRPLTKDFTKEALIRVKLDF